MRNILLFITLSLPLISNGQINYGSNKGKYITVKKSKIYYEEYGKGIPLILLHGGFGSIKNFKKVIGELSKHYRVIAMDSPGQGRSEQIDSISYQIYSDYYSEFIDKMKLDTVYVMGWSDGGNSAMILAYDRPDKVRKVVISGSNSDIDGYTDGVEGTQSLSPDSIPDWIREYWLDDFIKLSPDKDKWQKTFIDLKNMWLTKSVISDDNLSKINSKFLIVLGDRDMIKLEHGINLYRTIKGSQFCVLPNTTHFVFNEKPELINRIVIDFLK